VISQCIEQHLNFEASYIAEIFPGKVSLTRVLDLAK